MILNAAFRDVMRVTHLHSKISLVFPEDTVSVNEVLKAVKNIVYTSYITLTKWTYLPTVLET